LGKNKVHTIINLQKLKGVCNASPSGEKMRRFKHLSNKELVKVINERYANGLNDDDYVKELFRRRDKQGFKVVPKWDTYEIIEK
jgi:hypothetical protein